MLWVLTINDIAIPGEQPCLVDEETVLTLVGHNPIATGDQEGPALTRVEGVRARLKMDKMGHPNSIPRFETNDVWLTSRGNDRGGGEPTAVA